MIKTINLVKNNLEELPNNIEAEKSIIGSILLTNDLFYLAILQFVRQKILKMETTYILKRNIKKQLWHMIVY